MKTKIMDVATVKDVFLKLVGPCPNALEHALVFMSADEVACKYCTQVASHSGLLAMKERNLAEVKKELHDTLAKLKEAAHKSKSKLAKHIALGIAGAVEKFAKLLERLESPAPSGKE